MAAESPERTRAGEGLANEIEIWVAANGSPSGNGTRANPFGTIEAAQAAVRQILQSSTTLDKDIAVNIGGGTYTLKNTLSFSAADSGRDGHVVHYRAESGEHPVLSGGVAVTGWSPVANPGVSLAPGVKLWQASVAPGTDTRQLYFDGARELRAESNADPTYPAGFRPTYFDKKGTSGIEYVPNT